MQIIQISPGEWRFREPRKVGKLMEKFHGALDLCTQDKIAQAEKLLRAIIDECPEHIDALHHLAIIQGEHGKRQDNFLLEQEAVKVGLNCFPQEFTLGVDLLEWGWLENRPFLRAYCGLGLAYQDRGELEEARSIFLNLLEMNPDDNQGVRALVIECHFALNEPEKVLDVCAIYPDDTLPEVLYGKPLALLQINRPKKARKALKEAINLLPMVAEELIKKQHVEIKGRMDGYVVYGGEDQAYEYWEGSGTYWEQTPGALELIKEHMSA